MALRGAAARRYAQAVFDIGKDKGTLDRWLSDLKVLNGIFGKPSVVALVEDPRLTEEEQERIVMDSVSTGVVDRLAINLVLLLIRRQRLGHLPRILEVFQEMYNKEKGIVVADVTTAVPLDEAHRQRVAHKLSEITGKTVELRVHQDQRILGGMVTRIGDQLIDTSLATRLASLSERIT